MSILISNLNILLFKHFNKMSFFYRFTNIEINHCHNIAHATISNWNLNNDRYTIPFLVLSVHHFEFVPHIIDRRVLLEINLSISAQLNYNTIHSSRNIPKFIILVFIVVGGSCLFLMCWIVVLFVISKGGAVIVICVADIDIGNPPLNNMKYHGHHLWNA